MPAPIPLEKLPVFGNGDQLNPNSNWADGAVILMDKPAKWSSFKLVRVLRKLLNIKKIGHAGTLDPMATGLVILCTGKATRSIDQIQQMTKTYVAEVTFGASTPSYDAETEPDQTAHWEHITEQRIQKTLDAQFHGEIVQIAPAYSALKHKGKPLYKYARAGEETVKKERIVTVYECRLTSCNLPKITLEITCGKGTYIRSIAHDLGLALQSRGYLSSLRRTQTGSFHVSDAIPASTLETLAATKESREA